MNIRIATSLDRDDIIKVYLSAFPEGEKNIVSKLAVDLLVESAMPQTLSLVAENDNVIVGHVAFSPVIIKNDDKFQGYILAPLAVTPAYQQQGIGSKLVKSGIETLAKNGVNILFVYGDPKYYCRFGFSSDNANKFVPQHKLQYPFGWLTNVLTPFSMENLPSDIVCVAALNDQELW